MYNTHDDFLPLPTPTGASPSTNATKMPDSPELTSFHYQHTTNTTTPDPTSLSNLNRESAIALGILLLLILLAISWFATTRIRAHKAALRDHAHHISVAVATNHRLSRSTTAEGEPANGIIGYRMFKVSRDVSREGGTGGAEWRDGSVSTLPRYEERSSVGVLSERERQRQRRWWGSVAVHGTTTRADEELPPPLSPSPMLESLAYPAPMRAPIVGGFRNDIWHGGGGRSRARARQESIDAHPLSRDDIVEG